MRLLFHFRDFTQLNHLNEDMINVGHNHIDSQQTSMQFDFQYDFKFPGEKSTIGDSEDWQDLETRTCLQRTTNKAEPKRTNSENSVHLGDAETLLTKKQKTINCTNPYIPKEDVLTNCPTSVGGKTMVQNETSGKTSPVIFQSTEYTKILSQVAQKYPSIQDKNQLQIKLVQMANNKQDIKLNSQPTSWENKKLAYLVLKTVPKAKKKIPLSNFSASTRQALCNIQNLTKNTATDYPGPGGNISSNKNIQVWICELCISDEAKSSMFQNLWSFRKHLFDQHKHKLYPICQNCGNEGPRRYLGNSGTIVKHVLEKPSVQLTARCVVPCEYVLFSESILKYDNLIASFSCPCCNRTFPYQRDLEKHQFALQHYANPSTEKIFQCVNCKLDFSKSDDLKTHYKTVHNKSIYFHLERDKVVTTLDQGINSPLIPKENTSVLLNSKESISQNQSVTVIENPSNRQPIPDHLIQTPVSNYDIANRKCNPQGLDFVYPYSAQAPKLGTSENLANLPDTLADCVTLPVGSEYNEGQSYSLPQVISITSQVDVPCVTEFLPTTNVFTDCTSAL